jgi:phosphoglycolate phosphatase-like HAD superfamily hydrolase
MRKHGKPLDRPLLDRLNRRYVAHLAEEIQLPGTGVKDVMPGSAAARRALPARRCSAGTADGNFIDGARIKLGYFDLWRYFPCGAFGGDSANRNDLVPVAMRRAREAGIAEVESHRVIVVGDTPNDVECARVAGALPVAVATGSYSVEQLRQTGADIVFEDLSDTQAFLDLLSDPPSVACQP